MVLLGFAAVHLILAVMMMFVKGNIGGGQGGIYGGMFEIINVLFLGCAAMRMDFCCLVMYVINITIQWFQQFNRLGLLL